MLQERRYRNSEVFHCSPEWKKNLHYFAQWQCCFKDLIRLNQILMSPLPLTSPAFLYDGKLAMHLSEPSNLDRAVASFGIDTLFYNKLLRAVLS